MNVGVIILFVAILLFGILAFLQVSALILAPLVSIFVIIFSILQQGSGRFRRLHSEHCDRRQFWRHRSEDTGLF